MSYLTIALIPLLRCAGVSCMHLKNFMIKNIRLNYLIYKYIYIRSDLKNSTNGSMTWIYMHKNLKVKWQACEPKDSI